MATFLIVLGVVAAFCLGIGLLYVLYAVDEHRTTSASLEQARMEHRALTAVQEIRQIGRETEEAMRRAVHEQGGR